MLIACRAPTGPRVFPQMERLLDSWLAEQSAPSMPWVGSPFPALNVSEDADHFYVEAEVPGFTSDRIEVTAVGDELTIRGQCAPSEAQGTWLRRERPTRGFERTIRLPLPVDADHIGAELRAGVLTISLPKSPEARPRRVEVRAV